LYIYIDGFKRLKSALWFDYQKTKGILLVKLGFCEAVVTDPSRENGGCDCIAGLECIVNIIRALRMGSCLSAESRSPLPGSPSAGLGARKRKNSKKRFGSRNSSALQKTPGRLFANGSTQFASLFTQQGRKGTNQDAMIVWEVSLLR